MAAPAAPRRRRRRALARPAADRAAPPRGSRRRPAGLGAGGPRRAAGRAGVPPPLAAGDRRRRLRVAAAGAGDPGRRPRRQPGGAGPASRLFSSGRPTLGYLGRLLPEKNVEWLVDHLAALGVGLALQALDSELGTAAELERRAAARGVGDRVRFLPPGDDVGTLLRSVDALALLSRREAFPMAVVEAGWLGTPVVATRVGALPELFADAISFADDDDGVPRLASARAAVAEALSPAGGERACRLAARVRELCDPARVTAAYAELIDTALAVRRGRLSDAA
ncbi:MAG TPA: glycosyltransferase [Thermoanaerobaculia bacterium]|nr:glycosyltransferase [Thermoanaerobaculia bacterium]